MSHPLRSPETLQSAAVATGNGNICQVYGCSTVGMQVTIAATATITFEATVDGTTWVAVSAVNIGSGASGSTATATGTYIANVAGFLTFRARISTWGSGAVTVTALVTEEAGGVSAGGQAGEAHVGEVGGSATTISVTLTRPADTTTYTANDEMTDTGGAILTFASAARISGGTGYITDVIVVDSAAVATKAQLLLFLFDTTSTPVADNGAFVLTDAVLNTCIGVVPFNIWYPGDDTSGASGNAVGVYTGPPISFKTVGSANLFGRYKVLNGYVPVSGEVFVTRLKVRRD